MGGAGSGGPTQPTANALAGLVLTDSPHGPTLVTRLCDCPSPCCLTAALCSIFEPPRA
jgi:hypothetical protein